MEVATIIPCYRERFDRVLRTVESALAVRNVTRVIVVDDGCDDAGLDSLPCEVVHLSKHGGCSASLNAGIRLLGNDAIACRLDVGDMFYPEPKARQIDSVLSGVRCSSSTHFDPVTGEDWKVPANWARMIYADSVFTGCTNVYRVDVWREVGEHDETLRYCADWDFSMKVQYHIGWRIHDEVTCEAGMYPGGFSDRAQRDPATKKRRVDDRSAVFARGRILSHPDAHAHLFNEKWCRQRGIEPLKRKP